MRCIREKAYAIAEDVEQCCVNIVDGISSIVSGDVKDMKNLMDELNTDCNQIRQYLMELDKCSKATIQCSFDAGSWAVEGTGAETVVLGVSVEGYVITTYGRRFEDDLKKVDKPKVDLNTMFSRVGSCLWHKFCEGERVVVSDSRYAMLSYLIHGRNMYDGAGVAKGTFVGYNDDMYPFKTYSDKGSGVLSWKYCMGVN